ncbi:MAG: GNAT family acetyltransferase [Lachnospiraceae bacterium]|nr:GNAT family acetyltransferase [Lachnospiraceae bacterium]
MPENDKFFSVNIREYLALGNDEEAGEPALLELLSGFSCPKNPDVERFLKKSAIEFTKKNQSVTYLVVSAEDVRLLGYFTLALKPLTVRGETVSNTVKRKLLRISELDEKSDTYTMSAYLVAQLGKNFSESEGKDITGEELLKLAWDKIKEIQYLGGGIVTFLEAENEEKLLSFYRGNRFSQFDTRQTASDTDEPHELVQLLRLL